MEGEERQCPRLNFRAARRPSTLHGADEPYELTGAFDGPLEPRNRMQRRPPLVAHAGLAFWLLAAAGPSRAQAPRAPSGAGDSVRAARLAQLRPGAWVRVATMSGLKRTGEVRRARADSLLLARVPGARGGTLALHGADVQTLWEEHGRATRAGAATGAAVGGAVFGGLGLLAGGFMCEAGCLRTRATGAVLGAVTGAAAGALVGAAVGTLVPRWHRLVP